MNLEPIDPETALEMYLDSREREVTEATLNSHRSRLQYFTAWCYDNEIENLNELTGRDIHRYRLWRRNDGDLTAPSEKTQMDTIRVFIRWLESIDGVPVDLFTKVQSPTLSDGENVRDVRVDSEEADAILTELATFEYAGTIHVVLLLLWRTMMRRSSVRALDVEDYHPDEQYLAVTNRPDTGTRLKNGDNGERYVALREQTCAVLDDWIERQRPNVTDDFGRNPLISTAQGRIHVNTIQTYAYATTRPCFWGEGCPHDRDLDDCDGTKTKNQAHVCPSSKGPHAVRRGGITHNLKEGRPEKFVSDRADVSPDILEKHYDRRTEHEKMEQRREYL
ncbi:tyrosine-type recombinase/integrase [Natronosalvus vescus]|uniref:tyrosine-type recombinase/integrase n=1 Tax=Natronosalvus vescus TaxID=2953881 RepID=UPI0020900B28|nr:site-specific integrase [Natronosalvus vescus]